MTMTEKVTTRTRSILAGALSSAAIVSLGVGSVAPAAALEFNLGAVEASVDTTLTYTQVWRVERRNDSILNPNNDDGDRNFGRGLVSNIGRATVDIEATRDFDDTTVGVFVRGVGFYDTEIRDAGNAHDAPFFNNGNPLFGGPLTDLNRFTAETEHQAGSDARLLDAFVYLDLFNSSKHPVSLRVGKQVVNWGESLFIQSGITNAINKADVSFANTPGTEVKEILLPTNQVWGSVVIANGLNLQGFYQFDWDYTTAPPVGTYLSTNDFIADGGFSILLPPGGPINPGDHLRRVDNINPKNSGQFGVGVTWYSEELNSTEFGFYYVNYHSKLPNITLTGPPTSAGTPIGSPGELGTYAVTYFDDIKLYGMSFNTVVADIAVSGEVAYHDDVPLQTVALGAGLGQSIGGFTPPTGTVPVSLSTREELIVAQLTLNKTFNQSPILGGLADDVGGLFEVGLVTAPNLHDGEIFRGPTPVDATAWGYRGRLTLTYFDGIGQHIRPLSGTDLIVQINFSHDVDGVSPIPAGSFTEDTKSLGLLFTGSYQGAIEASIGYNFFWDSDLGDRDFASLTLKYRF